jgi:hypothetical protein
MSALQFEVIDGHAEPYAASPLLTLRCRITESTGADVYAIALRAQVMLEPQRRRYDGAEALRLTELFGKPDRYADTLRPMLWTHVSQMVLAFKESTQIDLPIPCSYDFEVAANKYLSALEQGEIPLNLLFSGTILTRGASGVASERVPWTCETRYRLPVPVWRATMDAFFPNCAWLRLERETFDELYRFKASQGLVTWDATLARLLEAAKVPE